MGQSSGRDHECGGRAALRCLRETRLSCLLEAEERTEDEKLRLGHLLKVLTHLRPGLVQCYDIEGFPRTNHEMERMIRAVKMQYRRISGRKNWNSYLLHYGRCVVYHEW